MVGCDSYCLLPNKVEVWPAVCQFGKNSDKGKKKTNGRQEIAT